MTTTTLHAHRYRGMKCRLPATTSHNRKWLWRNKVQQVRMVIPEKRCNQCGVESDKPLCEQCAPWVLPACEFCRYYELCQVRLAFGLHLMCEFPDNVDLEREQALGVQHEEFRLMKRKAYPDPPADADSVGAGGQQL